VPVKLYPEQEAAIKRMKNGCILCGNVGSGKSITSLAYYFINNGGDMKKMTMPDSPPKDLYIITTARKRDTFEWEKELAPFLLSTNDKVNHYSNHVVVDSWNNIRKYIDISGAFFIFDEQRVIGSGAWVKSFLKIVKKNEWILLSATPGDSWKDYIPVFIANGFYRNRSEFSTEHIVYRRMSKFPQIDRYINTGRLLRLRNEILVDMNVMRKTNRIKIDLDASYDIQKYKYIIKNRWDIWNNKPLENAIDYCLALRKVVNTDPSRAELVLDIIKNKNHPKVIIFYNYNYELDILRGLDYGKGFKVAEWNGKKHEPLPIGDKWVYLVQYAAGAEGWNCVTTDTIIFYSQNYSYKIVEQASGRIDRVNTPFNDLYYYHIKSKSSIDISIDRALRCKRIFSESAFLNNGG
jgi:hypothetical protein